MPKRYGSGVAILAVNLVSFAIVLSACGSAPSTSPSPSATVIAPPSASTSASIPSSPTGQQPPPSAATTYAEYAAAACAAWDALFRAVGNPDTGSGSDLSRSLDAAVTAGDVVSAERLASDISKELTAGRALVAAAGAWQPRAPTMVQFDRVFVAFQAMTAAKLAKAKGDPNATDPQSAFEQAGGVDAYNAMIALVVHASPPAGQTAHRCPNVPVTMP